MGSNSVMRPVLDRILPANQLELGVFWDTILDGQSETQLEIMLYLLPVTVLLLADCL
ncbi:MAG: hypothetical protein N2235_24470 [Fischerella sp.]|nr:hypothetical protein [Fischerella sp.]